MASKLALAAFVLASLTTVACTQSVEPDGQSSEPLGSFTPVSPGLFGGMCSSWWTKTHQIGVVAHLESSRETCPTLFVGRQPFSGEVVSSVIAYDEAYPFTMPRYVCDLTLDQIFSAEYPGIYPDAATSSVPYCQYQVAWNDPNMAADVAALASAATAQPSVQSVTPFMTLDLPVEISNGSGCSSCSGSRAH